MPYKQKIYSVNMLACKRIGTFYIGVTGDLPTRITQHKEGLAEGLTKKYGVKTLVWFESFNLVDLVIQYETTTKK